MAEAVATVIKCSPSSPGPGRSSSFSPGQAAKAFRSSRLPRTRIARQIEAAFFPRMDRFLDLARAAWNAVTQWPI